jgi:S-formylglutathione hydrolase FrmB
MSSWPEGWFADLWYGWQTYMMIESPAVWLADLWLTDLQDGWQT